ncbi:uncharacterized protein EDB93DRAFT_1331515 [Suillus bovinus]|uniref:uncharacterized protein n=1 Tax=Suillus bovinus TaxID=48563 RepID=UPI001B885DFE|nr:uncharacterized protein EDB93DRAFT_1331515 [Suillus bovinus]KAG2133266.1 hypothetical protein EDB93DRAFT_1331515 [Suillus bovinus]
MTVVSNDPSYWPTIDSTIFYSYFVGPWRASHMMTVMTRLTLAARASQLQSCAAVIYDWGLTFGQEVELIWRQRWSMMTVLYLIARYIAIAFSVINMLISLPTVSKTGTVSLIMIDAINWMSDFIHIILGVIAIARLHAMYQGSRKMLTFLIVIFLAIRIPVEVMSAMMTAQISGEEYILSGIYRCRISYPDNSIFLGSMTWILGTVWEVLSLCLAVWIAVKHFRELRRRSNGRHYGALFYGVNANSRYLLCKVSSQRKLGFPVPLKFGARTSFWLSSSLQISFFSPTFIAHEDSQGIQIYICLIQIFQMAQLSCAGTTSYPWRSRIQR